AVRVARTAILRRALAGADFRAIHVSDLGRRTIAPHLPPGARQRIVANPVRIARGERAALPGDGPVVYVGRFTREKGAAVAARAAARAGWPALFVGDGPAEADIRAAHPGAEIAPWATPAEIDRILRTRARALIAPSRWPETGPLTIYEAMAAGVPAIGSTLSGAAERLTEGVTGFVVAPTPDANALALAALAVPGRAKAMGAAAHDDYWARPQDFAAHAAALLRLYDDMLDGRD
ncbi:MAG: glycosyltransferase, partial [Hyphomicrobiales bacterium]|nr:glycosyltransferase [Hyphomicrobiales bacterium]